MTVAAAMTVAAVVVAVTAAHRAAELAEHTP
jgi:hypothetical protein